jgi:hypothetical protein
MTDNLKPGTKVEWNSHGSKVEGTVVKEITSDTKIMNHQVRASKENPQYLVKSKKSERKAAHKSSALKKK